MLSSYDINKVEYIVSNGHWVLDVKQTDGSVVKTDSGVMAEDYVWFVNDEMAKEVITTIYECGGLALRTQLINYFSNKSKTAERRIAELVQRDFVLEKDINRGTVLRLSRKSLTLIEKKIANHDILFNESKFNFALIKLKVMEVSGKKISCFDEKKIWEHYNALDPAEIAQAAIPYDTTFRNGKLDIRPERAVRFISLFGPVTLMYMEDIISSQLKKLEDGQSLLRGVGFGKWFYIEPVKNERKFRWYIFPESFNYAYLSFENHWKKIIGVMSWISYTIFGAIVNEIFVFSSNAVLMERFFKQLENNNLERLRINEDYKNHINGYDALIASTWKFETFNVGIKVKKSEPTCKTNHKVMDKVNNKSLNKNKI